jgi:hypothetical protein
VTDLLISVAQERSACAFTRPYLIPVLRNRQSDRCWFCSEALPDEDEEIDVHHEVPLHVSFADGYGKPTSAHNLHLTHRECHANNPRGVR